MCLQPDYTEKRICALSAAEEQMALSRRIFTELRMESPSSAFQEQFSVCHFGLLEECDLGHDKENKSILFY